MICFLYKSTHPHGMWCISFALIITFFLAGCKKHDDETGAPGDGNHGQTPTTDLVLLHADSLFLYAKEVYLWNGSLPDYDAFDPRQYADNRNELNGLNASLFAITRYAKDEHGTDYEYVPDYPSETKYSFIDDIGSGTPLAFHSRAKSAIGDDGIGYDIGLEVGLYGADNHYEAYIQYVFPGSPAAKAGLERGDIITSIDGHSIGSNYDNEIDYINDGLFNNSSVSLKVSKINGTTVTVNLSKTSYDAKAVMLDSVYKSGSQKIGYLAFYQFTSLNHAQPELDEAFGHFRSAGVNRLIVDLRYNGGGFVSTAEHLLNLIAPPAANGKTMTKEYYNSTMQDGKATILKNQPLLDDNGNVQRDNNNQIVTYADLSYSVDKNTYSFSTADNPLTIDKVVFIVNSGTASASELVINSLKPYVDVQLVGNTTYGKPVGFFPIRIGHYNVYYSMFQSKNADDEGDYFDGMTPDYEATDNPLYPLGDKQEDCFEAAYAYLVNGSYPASGNALRATIRRGTGVSLTAFRPKSAKQLHPGAFRGMIENPARLVK